MQRTRAAAQAAPHHPAIHLPVLMAALLLTPMITACGSPSDASTATPSAPPTSAASASDGSAAPGDPTTPTGAAPTRATTPATAVANCPTSSIKAQIALVPQKNFTGYLPATLTLTNTGTRACRLSGWVGVINENGEGAPAPLTVTKVNKPTAAVTVDLAPGGSAVAGMKWTYCDNTTDDTCVRSGGVSVSVPGDSHTTNAHITPEPDEQDASSASGFWVKAVQLGPIQPNATNVLGW